MTNDDQIALLGPDVTSQSEASCLSCVSKICVSSSVLYIVVLRKRVCE